MRLSRSVRVGVFLFLCSSCTEPGTSPPETGWLDIYTETFGTDLDNSYRLSLGIAWDMPILANELKTLRLETGPQTLLLDQVAPNCVVHDSNTRTVTVTADQRVTAKFVVDCAATGLKIETRTTGTDIPNIFTIEIDHSMIRSIFANDSIVITQMQPGHHTVSVIFGGENCATVTGDEQFPARVENRAITSVVLEIACKHVVPAERIAFVSDTINSFREFTTQVSLVNPDGTGVVRLGHGHSPSWSPDGKKLVYSTTVCDDYTYFYYHWCPGGLVIKEPETGSKVELNEGIFAISPAWSPKEDLIVFTDFITGLLYSTNPNERDGTRRPINVVGALRLYDPAWSPDGNRLIAGCYSETTDDLCTFRPDGSDLKVLARGGANAKPSWSPDGEKIAFTTLGTATSPQQIAIINPDGSGLVQLTDGFSPAWSRDGKKIVFARSAGLFIMNSDGTGVSRLTLGHDHDPVWRP